MKLKELAVISVTYKYPKGSLDRFIKNIVTEGIKKSDIFIVDNSDINLGYGGGINSILKKTVDKYEYFLILNPDVEIKRGSVKKLLETLHNPVVGIVGPKLLTEKGKIWSLGGVLDKKRYSGGLISYEQADVKNSKKPKEVDFISGTVMLIKREVFKKVGFFKEDYFLYYEDVDFCLRAAMGGYKNVVVPDAVVIHKASSSVGKNSPAMIYYLARNHLLFLERFAPLSVKVREFIRLPRTIFQARSNPHELQGINDFFLRKFGRNDSILSLADKI